jgi:signal transduction histidine kinase
LSLGLMGLRERAHLLKGAVTIESEPGRGTRIQVRIPMQEDVE